jgi:hypothetical protein
MLWNRLEPSATYSQLHFKFWGVDIATSRRDWWRSQKGKITIGRNEIDEESFALDLDMPNFQRSRLWVRKDYVRIYDYCNKRFEHEREHPSRDVAPSVVITGQPGIGEASRILIIHYLKSSCLERESLLDQLCHPSTAG